jgi:hypothetical protein
MRAKHSYVKLYHTQKKCGGLKIKKKYVNYKGQTAGGAVS